MDNVMFACKAISSIAISAAVAFGLDRTQNANCLWALLFVCVLWAA